MSGYEAPIEVRELEKMINSLAYQCGKDPSQIFDDFLTYIIHGCSPLDGPLDTWKYKKEHTILFYQMYTEWLRIMAKESNILGWYDAFGDLYMSCVVGKSKQQGTGQFFTPSGICNLMSELNAGNEKITGKYISDPTCGSGRTLLAWHVRNLGNYLCAEDMDRTCCLMTVCNFFIHGCIGEVIWHNSLEPDSFFDGWKVNEVLTTSGMPSIRRIKQTESKTWQFWQYQKKAANTSQIDKKIIIPQSVVSSKIQQPERTKKRREQANDIQLKLFDF